MYGIALTGGRRNHAGVNPETKLLVYVASSALAGVVAGLSLGALGSLTPRDVRAVVGLIPLRGRARYRSVELGRPPSTRTAMGPRNSRNMGRPGAAILGRIYGGAPWLRWVNQDRLLALVLHSCRRLRQRLGWSWCSRMGYLRLGSWRMDTRLLDGRINANP